MKKILIANRSEIAVRIIKTAKKLGIETVAVYSKSDAESLHVAMADESYFLGDDNLAESYLNIPKIIAAAKQTGADAIHPGYGFLAENPEFADACKQHNIVFIGPSSKLIKLMGNKIDARSFIIDINVPTVKSATGSPDELAKAATEIGFPVLLKAAAGGGGKGMRIVHNESEVAQALETTSREALNYFGNGDVYIEKYIINPRHIEVQILGDKYGNVVHLFERECSIQRRYQKIIEEAPSPTLTPEVREKICNAAVKIAKEANYENAGTIEFLVDNDLNFYFLEMNTRIQVEHPVTELITGIDIIEQQIKIASGETLQLSQDEITMRGQAIECRIYAEKPEQNFMPAPGKMTFYKEPDFEGIRLESALTGTPEIHSFFDPMISKLIVWDIDRESATHKMVKALDDYIIHGIENNILFLKRIITGDDFIDNRLSTKYIETNYNEILMAMGLLKDNINSDIPLALFVAHQVSKSNKKTSVWNEIGYWRNNLVLNINFDKNDYSIEIKKNTANQLNFYFNKNDYSIEIKCIKENFIQAIVNNYSYKAYISSNSDGIYFINFKGLTYKAKREDVLIDKDYSSETENQDSQNAVFSPMPGKVVAVKVSEGDEIKKGDILVVVESMKMENNITAGRDAIIGKINVQVGDKTETNKALIEFKLDTRK